MGSALPSSLKWWALAVGAIALVALAACSPLRTINALVPGHTHVLTEAVPFGPDARHRLDVYRPTVEAPQAGYPVVVFFYGGSWNVGERAQYRFVAEALAARGILVLVPDYRLYPQVTYPDFLPDCAKAVAYALVHAPQYGGDARRVAVMGHSAGGYNAAMMALDDRWLSGEGHHTAELAGWVGLAGPYDFLPIVNPDVKPVFHFPDSPPDSQPIRHVTARAPRTFLGAASTDDVVNPVRNSAQLAQRLQDAGVPVVFKRYDRVNHLTLIGAFARPLRWLAPVLDDVVAFVSALPPVVAPIGSVSITPPSPPSPTGAPPRSDRTPS